MKLTAENVSAVVVDCLFRDGEDHADMVVVEGITTKWGFHPDRLKEHREDIRSLLGQLPEEFAQGWSFLNACVDRKGEQWGEHRSMDELFSLGQATGLVACLMPREFWGALPGGMPYYQVRLES
jgi:hypothetical protein